MMRAFKFLSRTVWLWRHAAEFSSLPASNRPRLLVDVSVIVRNDAQTGIQRVVRAVWSELLKRVSDNFELVPVCATSRKGYCEAPLDFLEKRSPVVMSKVVKCGPNDAFLGLDLSTHSLPAYGRQLRAWQANGARINVVIYDLLPLTRPEFFEKTTVSDFRRWFAAVATQADALFCISRQVGRDVRERLRLDYASRNGPTVKYLKMGCDMAASRPSRGVSEDVPRLLRRMRFRPAILLVGTVEPRKAYDVALAAFEYLWENHGAEAPDMVIVGKPGWKTAELQQRIRDHPEYGGRLHWLSSVSDEALCHLYDACRGLLMPSHAEGFGLPLLEGACHNHHILARDLPVFREHELPNLSFFEDDQPEPLARAILELSAKGLNRPGVPPLPTWSKSVEQLLVDLALIAAAGKSGSRRLQVPDVDAA